MLDLQLHRSRLVTMIADWIGQADQGEPNGHIDLSIPILFRRRGVEAKIVIGDHDGKKRRSPDPKLVGLIAKAHGLLASITTGAALSIDDLARQHAMDSGDASRLLSLAFLAPSIVEAIVEGSQPIELTATSLLRASPLPHSWDEQRRALNF